MSDSQFNPYSSPQEIQKYDVGPAAGYQPGVIVPVPTVATVFGILNMIWGFLGIFPTLYKGLLCGMAFVFGVMFLMPDQDMGNIPEDAKPIIGGVLIGVGVLMLLWFFFDVMILIMLFMIGVWLLQGRVVGRLWALRGAYCSLASQTLPLLLIVGGLIFFAVIGAQGFGGNPRGATQMIVQSVFQLTCVSLGLIFPTATLIAFSGSRSRQALEAYESYRGSLPQ